MPFTPLHFGLGYVASCVERKPKFFCLYTFILTQVVIDIETLTNIIINAIRLHTFFHTFLGSLVAATISIGLVPITYKFGESILNNIPLRLKEFFYAFRLFPSQPPAIKTIVFSALFGAWSHVILDAIMHPDTRPFSPFSNSNPFLYLISFDELHLSLLAMFCVSIFFLLRRNVAK